MLFAFGQTGSGKTHTVLGSPASGSDVLQLDASNPDAGLLPAALSHAFQLVPHVPERVYQVCVSAAEVYNERACDLLAGGCGAAVRQHPQRGFYVEGLRHVACSSAAQAAGVLQRALVHRCAEH